MCDVVCKVAGYFQDESFYTVRQKITKAQNVIEGYSPIQSGAHKRRYHTSSGVRVGGGGGNDDGTTTTKRKTVVRQKCHRLP